MFKWFYVLNAVISFISLLYYFETSLTKVNQKQILLLVFITFANLAYALTTFTQSIEAAFALNISYYISTTLTMIMFMLVILELCNFKIKQRYRIMLFIYDALLIFFVATVKHFKFYYTDFSLSQFLGATYIVKKYGILHFMLLLLVGSVNIISIGAVIYSTIKNKKMSRKLLLTLLSILVICSLIYFTPRFFNTQIEFMPFAFAFTQVLITFIFRRASMYDMSANLLNAYEQRNEYGYISFDLNLLYMGCNEFAKTVFPELDMLRIDSKVPESFTTIHYEILTCIENFKQQQHHEHTYKNGKYSVICTVTNIFSNKKPIGYLIELRDNTKQQQQTDLLKDYSNLLQSEVERKTQKISDMQNSIITGMATMVESRDNSTGGHIKRTSEGVKVFIEALQKHPDYSYLSNQFCSNMVKAAPMHDLGKIAVDDAVLRKPGKYEPEEYEKMKCHSAEGAKIVKQVLKDVEDENFKTIAVNVAHFHHEKWNGTGYPTGLSGQNIPIEARIMAFADVFDALVSKRCYKDAFTFDRAFEIIQKDSGTHFDPDLSKVFLSCRSELEKLYQSFED